ncbi:DUF2150 family protein [Halocatena pleomorpha]|uniref:DUF2150 family protein n=1 Tax=Halocatena pleomorpha TaxID=1785090 RepID=A0A3P3RAR3_9EURY|nr:DUF2150 family protein [Halocatena pleomorpha]RRJ30546.1 DUF2150 family protein [Halocatena pleomorpha]
MSAPEGEYYTEERWQNWIDRLTAEEIDLEDEESGRLLQNFQDDTVIAIAKIVSDYDDEMLDEETALSELADVREIVLTDLELDEENTLMLVNAVQTALVCVFYAAEEYVVDDETETDVEQCIHAARDAEAQEEFETALGYCAQAGSAIIAGEELPPDAGEEIEYGPVADWITGLRSLQGAMADPEVVEPEDSESAS